MEKICKQIVDVLLPEFQDLAVTPTEIEKLIGQLMEFAHDEIVRPVLGMFL